MNPLGRDRGVINLDQPYDLQEYPVLPDWVFEKINETNAYDPVDVFPSQKLTPLESIRSDPAGHSNRKLYPVTVFGLIQLLTAEMDVRFHKMCDIRDRHKNRMRKYDYKYTNPTYWYVVQSLIDAGLLAKIKDDGEVKYGLPEGRPVAPVFEQDGPDSLLDRIVVDDPTTLKDAYQSTILPISLGSRRSITSSTDPFATLWDSGYTLLAAGAFFAVGYADMPLVNLFDPTSPVLIVFWALISVGIATIVVDILDQIRIGYETKLSDIEIQ